MYNNIGNTIKSWAKISFLIGLIICEVIGIYIFADSALTGIILCIGVPLILLGNSWLIYGFGQLIENTDILVSSTQKILSSKKSTVSQSTKKVLTAKEKEFIADIKATETDYLKLILQDQKDLYSPAEITVIEHELLTRK